MFGILYFYIGRIVALTFIFKLCMSAKNVVYVQERGLPRIQHRDDPFIFIDKSTKFIVSLIHSILGVRPRDPTTGKGAEGTQAITFVIEYILLAGMALLIAANVQSFLRKLLVTLKNIMRDNEI